MTEPMTIPLDTHVEAPAESSVEQTQEPVLHSVPEPNPTVETTEVTPEQSAVEAREEARTTWRRHASAGTVLTGRELGTRFGRSERWGRDRIAEARNETRAAEEAAGDGAGVPARSRRPRGAGSASTSASAARRHRHTVAGTSSGPDAEATGSTAASTAAPVSAHDAAGEMARQPGGVPAGARLVAWAGFLFGTLISVAANVLYVWLPAMRGEVSAPGLAPQVGAAVWPIALVISVEVLSRVAWRPGWAWQMARYGGAGVVAVGAAVISYGHLKGVLTDWGYDQLGAAVGPLVIDGLMTISGFALLAMSDHGTRGTEQVQ